MNRQQDKHRKPRDAAGATVAPAAATILEQTQIAKYHTKGGHGFAAEDANDVADRLRGKNAAVVGKTNESNGADRLVGGVRIQSKYCKTAAETVRSAFHRGGNYRYAGQVLEVPNDQYDQCVEHMRRYIREGRVPGHANPADAEKLVAKGTVTYRQARNIARAGNVDSVKFDVKTGAAVAVGTVGLSFALNYAQACRQGLAHDDALLAAARHALAAGSTAWVAHLISAQLLRTKAAAVCTVTTRGAVRAAAHSAIGRKAVDGIARASLGKAVHGAAAVNHVSKLLRSNAVTGSVMVAVSCAPDFYRAAFDQSISWQQFTKNTAVQAAGVAGGVGGWMGGAAVGASVGSAIPGIGTAIGGLIGGAIGALGIGGASGALAKTIADEFVEDDAKRLLRILQKELQTLAHEYMLSMGEFEEVVEVVRGEVDGDWLRGMYRETRGKKRRGAKFVRGRFEPNFQDIVGRRPVVPWPGQESPLVRLVRSLARLARNLGRVAKNKIHDAGQGCRNLAARANRLLAAAPCTRWWQRDAHTGRRYWRGIPKQRRRRG